MTDSSTPTASSTLTAHHADDADGATAALHVRDVTLSFPDGERRLTVLDRVSLTLNAGTFTALVGPSGSGKSSLLAVAGALTSPDSGEVWVNGREISSLDAGHRARVRREEIGFVFQQPQLLASLTVVEQLQVMGHLGGHSAAVPESRALELLDRVGLADQARRRPQQLSGGQRQRVALARALVHDPSVLLVDEPTSALDHERGAAVMDLLREVTREAGTATLVVTHDTALLEPQDRVVLCADGRLREQEAPMPQPALRMAP